MGLLLFCFGDKSSVKEQNYSCCFCCFVEKRKSLKFDYI